MTCTGFCTGTVSKLYTVYQGLWRLKKLNSFFFQHILNKGIYITPILTQINQDEARCCKRQHIFVTFWTSKHLLCGHCNVQYVHFSHVWYGEDIYHHISCFPATGSEVSLFLFQADTAPLQSVCLCPYLIFRALKIRRHYNMQVVCVCVCTQVSTCVTPHDMSK